MKDFSSSTFLYQGRLFLLALLNKSIIFSYGSSKGLPLHLSIVLFLHCSFSGLKYVSVPSLSKKIALYFISAPLYYHAGYTIVEPTTYTCFLSDNVPGFPTPLSRTHRDLLRRLCLHPAKRCGATGFSLALNLSPAAPAFRAKWEALVIGRMPQAMQNHG